MDDRAAFLRRHDLRSEPVDGPENPRHGFRTGHLRAGPARVGQVDGDPRALEPAGQLVRPERVDQLRPAVGSARTIVLLRLKSSRSSFARLCAHKLTFTMRDGAHRWSIGKSRLVSRTGARWITASVPSIPSAVSHRLAYIAPALFTSASSRSWLASNSLAKRWISACEERSATISSTASLPLLVLISAVAVSPLPRSRPITTNLAPKFARPSAVALPIPPVPPVTSTIFPFIIPLRAFMPLLRARRVVFLRPNGTKLAHHVQLVGDAPVLDDLALRHSLHRHALDTQLPSRRSGAEELGLMGTFERVASCDFVALSDHVLDNDPEIRHGTVEHAHDLFDAFRARWQVRSCEGVVDVLGCQQLIEEVEVALLPHLPEPAHDGLALLCRHRLSLLSSFPTHPLSDGYCCGSFDEQVRGKSRRLQRSEPWGPEQTPRTARGDLVTLAARTQAACTWWSMLPV